MRVIRAFFILLIFFSTHSFAQSIHYKNDFLNLSIAYDKNISLEKIKKIEELIKLSLTNKYIINSISSLDINMKIFKGIRTISTSNAASQCNVELNYDSNLHGVLLANFFQDLQFTIYHEISHCILGKKIFREGVPWSSYFSENEKNNLDKKIDKLTDETTIQDQCNLNCLPQTLFNKPPPLTIYHEIFADGMAMALYQGYNCKEAKKIFSEINYFRYEKYHKQPFKNIHQSFRAFNYWNDDEFCYKEIDFKKISFYTQQGFIDYLNE